MTCSACNGLGTLSGCESCGAVQFLDVNQSATDKKYQDNRLFAEVPKWYATRPWDLSLSKSLMDSKAETTVKELLDKFVNSSHDGTLPQTSMMFLLPDNSGKRIAMYQLIKNYLSAGKFVPPVMDIFTFNLMSSRNRREDQEQMLNFLNGDISFVYGTSFGTRKFTASLFLDICNTRSLRNKATIFFGDDTHEELSAWCKVKLDIKKNKDSSINHLQYPIILDGVIGRK
jgi:hypothetical protein